MKKNAYAETTIYATDKRLRHMKNKCNLDKPEEVKGFIANKNCTSAYKESLTEGYDHYCKANDISWNKPFYQRYDKLPRIPKTEHLNVIIANGSPRMALILSILKDLGMRPIEITWLKVKEIDLETGLTNITSAKHCIGRTLKLKSKTLDMLKQYINKKELKQNDRLFPTKSKTISENYRRIRNKLAKKLQNPTIVQIRLYDFRHHYATMLYHRTKDLLYVKASLGHKDLRITLRYTQLVETSEEDEYHCKVATSIKEATKLIEKGFEYVTKKDNTMIFKKRK